MSFAAEASRHHSSATACGYTAHPLRGLHNGRLQRSRQSVFITVVGALWRQGQCGREAAGGIGVGMGGLAQWPSPRRNFSAVPRCRLLVGSSGKI